MKSQALKAHVQSHIGAMVISALIAATSLNAADGPAETNAPAPAAEKAAAPAEKGAPLPLHQIEGNGGVFSTLSAYIVNPPRNGEAVGRPSLGAAYVNIGHGQNLEALSVTESPFSRLELGYGWDRMGLGDLPGAIKDATTVRISTKIVEVHNLNARFQLVKEGEFDQKWLPAITLGSHYKINDGISRIDSDLGGALSDHRINHHSGEDVTLYGSKLFTQLPRPVILELGGRATRAVWDGLGGFTPSYSFLFEGNVIVLITDNLVAAVEYKQQANDYRPIGDLVGKSGDWWTLDVGYIITKHWTVAAGYGNFGGVLNHRASGVWGVTTKFEF